MIRVNGSAGYRADVDGLRALAVLLVVLCHAGVAGFDGGFVGVDVFFVISGYVVTRSLRRSLEEGEFSFGDFYIRRARRLLPALYAMMTAVLAFSVLFMLPMDASAVAKNIGFVTLLASNLYLAKQTGYFDPAAEQQPLLHTWSLSVEEQFYLFLPVILYGMRRWTMRRQLALMAGLLLASLAASQLAVWRAQPGGYYMAHLRAFEFLVGVLAAFVPGRSAAAKAVGADVAVVVGLGAVLVCTAALKSSTPFPGLLALVPCIGVAAVVLAGPQSRVASWVLANRWSTALGRASYSIYLWHWPVLFALRRFDQRGPEWTALGVLLSLALGAASYRWIEAPFRFGDAPRRQAVARFMVAPALAVAVLVVVGKFSDGFVFAYPHAFRTAYAQAKEGTWDDERGKACWERVEVTDPAQCRLGETSGSPSAVLWGDSHAYHLVQFADQLGAEYGLRIHDVAFPMCPPVESIPARAGDPRYEANRGRCAQHNANVMRYLLASPAIDTVILSAVWDLYANGVPRADAVANIHGYMPGDIDRALGDTVGKLLAAGKHVVLFDDIALMPMGKVNCPLYNRLWLQGAPRDCTFALKDAVNNRAAVLQVLERLQASHPAVAVVRTYGASCPAGRCLVEYEGVPLYRLNDYGHLSMAGSRVYYDLYQRAQPGQLAEIFGRAPPAKPQLAKL